jgi:uroporphyrinogen-III synthase
LADALVATGSLDNAKVLVITGNLNRDTLVKRLEAGRAIVDRLQTYENVRTDLTSHPAAEAFRERGADAILFASASAAQAFAAQAAVRPLAPGAKQPLAGSIGPATSEALRAAGLPVDFESKAAGLEGLVAALIEKLAAG